MTRGRGGAVLLVVLLPVLAVALVLERGHDRRHDRRHQHGLGATAPAAAALPDRPSSYAAAAAANFRLLSPRQSRRLLDFADGLAACLRNGGVDVGAPKPSRTRINLALPPGVRRRVVLARVVACGDALGGPPPGASVQLRPTVNAILVYLPRYCLLDPEVSGG